MSQLYAITLTPIESVEQPGRLESIVIIAKCDGVSDKVRNLTPKELARVLSMFFSPPDISVIEKHLESGKSVVLPKRYSFTELASAFRDLGNPN